MTLSIEDLRRMAERPVADAADAVVNGDVPCRRCQYNLRGLSTDGRCPECGTPVGYSTRGDLLRFSEPTWVGTLRAGVSVILWGILFAILAALSGSALRQLAVGQGPPLVVGLASGLLSLAGAWLLAWLLTTPDPSGLGEDRYGTSGKVIRVTLVIGIVQQLSVLLQRSGNWPPAADLLFTTVAIVAGLIAVVGKFATLNYLGKLARRIPDPSLERRARLLMYGYGIPLAVVAVGNGLVLAFGRGVLRRGRPGAGLVTFGCGAGVAGLALIVFGLMYLFMLGRFSKAFKTQAAIARSTWAADQPPGAPPATAVGPGR